MSFFEMYNEDLKKNKVEEDIITKIKGHLKRAKRLKRSSKHKKAISEKMKSWYTPERKEERLKKIESGEHKTGFGPCKPVYLYKIIGKKYERVIKYKIPGDLKSGIIKENKTVTLYEFVGEYRSMGEASRNLKVDLSYISRIVNNGKRTSVNLKNKLGENLKHTFTYTKIPEALGE